MALPQSARLAIKDAAGAYAMQDLIPSKDFEALTAVWNRSIRVAKDLDQLREAHYSAGWPGAPWRWPGS